MVCERCQGLMVADCYVYEGGRCKSPFWRCIACGEIIDAVILLNRGILRSQIKLRHFKFAKSHAA